MDLYDIYKKRKSIECQLLRFCFMFSITRSLFTVCTLLAWMDQFMGKRRIKFSPNDKPLADLSRGNKWSPKVMFQYH